MNIFFKNVEDRDYDRLRDIDARRVFNSPLHAEEALAQIERAMPLVVSYSTRKKVLLLTA